MISDELLDKYPSISNIMPDMIPDVIEVVKSVPRRGVSSGVETSGRALEYRFNALNLVRHPREILPPE